MFRGGPARIAHTNIVADEHIKVTTLGIQDRAPGYELSDCDAVFPSQADAAVTGCDEMRVTLSSDAERSITWKINTATPQLIFDQHSPGADIVCSGKCVAGVAGLDDGTPIGTSSGSRAGGRRAGKLIACT